MLEGQNIDIAHHLHEVSEKLKEEERRQYALIEIGEALLLALVAILTAWSGYQSALWDERNGLYYGEATNYGVAAAQASAMGGHYQLFDAATLTAWLAATELGDAKRAALYEQRFTPAFRVAFDVWLKTDPFHNPKAPPGPALMLQYHNPWLAQADRLNLEASAAFEQGTSASDVGDTYVRAGVLLALVLFLVALSQRFTLVAVRAGLLVLGGVLMLVAAIAIATYPVA